jgi:3-oxoacid CoA-transferase subunit A
MKVDFGKCYPSASEALHDLREGARIMVGGFGLCGNPEALIGALAAKGTSNLTIISNNCGNQGQGLAVLLKNHQVAAWKGSFMGGNPDIQEQYAAGAVDVELIPQGTLAERIRAAGAGIPAFFTPTGAGTVVSEGKETRQFNGRPAILEQAISADFAFIRAQKADAYGNARFYGTTRNFQIAMAMAAKTTLVEADEWVPLGELEPDDIHLPGIFVQRVITVKDHLDPIEYRTTRSRP